MPLDDESREIDAAVARLVDQFPDADASDVRASVQHELTQFDDAAVRDFVPVLVERSVGEHLRETHESHVRTSPDGDDRAPAGDK